MILKELKYDFLRYAKGFCFSENYSIFCTGARTFICDRQLNILYTVEKLSYVYHAYISPDEETLLLVSNSNIFYLVGLKDFSLKKYTIRDKYNDNLEGRGCWSFDGNSLLFDVNNRKTNNSALRRYDLSCDMSYEDMLAEKYRLVSITPIKELNKYLLIGQDRQKPENDDTDRWSMIWFDGSSFEEYPIKHAEECRGVIVHAEYEHATNTVILYGIRKTFRCDRQGRIIEEISSPSMENGKISFSSAVSLGPGAAKEVGDPLTNLSALSETESLQWGDRINKICISSDGKKYYVGTNLGLYVVDAKTREPLKKEAIDYGVHDIAEISPGTIAVSTWTGVKVFESSD